jgi:multidrug efflux pump subunit AcrA (membrane-fusion protein)
MRGIAVILALALVSCSRSPVAVEEPVTTQSVPIPDIADKSREIRLTGLVEAARSVRVSVPAITGQNPQLTLTRLVANGAQVEAGDVIAEFDPLDQMEAARTARSKSQDLSHQVEQKAAQNHADEEKRRSDLRQAEADMRKAELELAKAPILADIAKQQNEIRAKSTAERVASMRKAQEHRDKAAAAAIRILELQRDRQQVALQRAEDNMAVMQLKAPISGMVAHAIQYRSGSITHAQEGDRLYRGNGLVSIFDPSEMRVKTSVGEPDRALLKPGLRATVYVDAYPDLALPARFENASPIASAALGTSVKTFTAMFLLEESDPRLVPDLSAAVVIRLDNSGRLEETER